MTEADCPKDSDLAYCLDAVNLVRLRGYLWWVRETLKDQSRCVPE